MIRTRTQRSAGGRVLQICLLLAAIVALGLMLAARPAHAVSTFTVDSTADTNLTACTAAANDCTLRGAINAANSTANSGGPDAINFAIPGAGPHTISPTSALPSITEAATIDGYTQPGSSPNTQTQGTNAVLKIELDGTNAGGGADGLSIGNNASNTLIRGLVINRFRIGVFSSGGTTGVKVEGNFLGTNAAGDADQGNRDSGVGFFTAAGATIGGVTPDKRNVISGNDNAGVVLNSGASGVKVEGNLIGTGKDGTSPLGNGEVGVPIVNSSGNIVGGTASGAANTIAFNGSHGVNVVANSTGNRILGNSIHSNGGLGLDLSGGTQDANAVTKNDKKDPDTGPNDLQNFPVLTSAETSGGSTTVEGTLNSTPSTTFTVQFFASETADPSGHGEGQTFLGETTATTDANGDASFTFTETPAVPGGEFVTANATSPTNDTSEFSAAVVANAPPVAGNDSYKAKQNKTLTVPASSGVLENDSDPDGGSLAARRVSKPSKGKLTLNANGSFTYKPKKNFKGSDSFTYEVSDGRGGADTATVSIRVKAARR